MSADPAVFQGVVNDDGTVKLDFPQQQRAYCRAKLKGACVDVVIAPAGSLKTRLQEQGFHAMIAPWAKSEGHRVDDLKRDLLRAIFGEQEHVNPITGEIAMVLREPHTSTLNRAKYSELIERALEIAAECGVVLVAPNEYRRQREQAEKKRKARAA